MANVTRTEPPRFERPTSPHLQIFRPIITMMMSIAHRITGAMLYVGTLLVVWWLVSAASGPEYYEFVSGLFGSILGMLVLFVYSWVLFQHMLGGIRHLIWDSGAMMDPDSSRWLAWASLIGALALTLLVWIVALLID